MAALTRTRAWGRVLAAGVAIVCAALALHLAGAQSDEAHLEDANTNAILGRFDEAIAAAGRADGRTSASRAAALTAYARLAQGDRAAAAPAFSAALEREPNNWVLQRDYAITLLALGRREKAQARMRQALRLNPRLDAPPGFAVVSE